MERTFQKAVDSQCSYLISKVTCFHSVVKYTLSISELDTLKIQKCRESLRLVKTELCMADTTKVVQLTLKSGRTSVQPLSRRTYRSQTS